jgi:hypothetical protein
MIILLSVLFAIVVGIVGYIVLPIATTVITLPTLLLLRPINGRLAYLVSRYIDFAVCAVLLSLMVSLPGTKFQLITWPAWIAAGWSFLTIGNTLILWDLRCYLMDTGAWAPREIAVIDHS